MSLSAVPQRCVPRTERRAGAAGIPRTGRVRVLQMEPPPCSKAPSLPALPVLCPRSLARGVPGLSPPCRSPRALGALLSCGKVRARCGGRR